MKRLDNALFSICCFNKIFHSPEHSRMTHLLAISTKMNHESDGGWWGRLTQEPTETVVGHQLGSAAQPRITFSLELPTPLCVNPLRTNRTHEPFGKKLSLDGYKMLQKESVIANRKKNQITRQIRITSHALKRTCVLFRATVVVCLTKACLLCSLAG